MDGFEAYLGDLVTDSAGPIDYTVVDHPSGCRQFTLIIKDWCDLVLYINDEYTHTAELHYEDESGEFKRGISVTVMDGKELTLVVKRLVQIVDMCTGYIRESPLNAPRKINGIRVLYTSVLVPNSIDLLRDRSVGC